MPRKRSHAQVAAAEQAAKRAANIPLYNFDELFSAGLEWASERQALLAALLHDIGSAPLSRQRCKELVTPEFEHCWREGLKFILTASNSDDDTSALTVRYLRRELDLHVRFVSDAHTLHAQYARETAAVAAAAETESATARELRLELIRALCRIRAPFINRDDERTVALISELEQPAHSTAAVTTTAASSSSSEPTCRICKRGLLVYYKLDAVDVCQSCGAVEEVGIAEDVMPPPVSHKGVPSGVSVQKKRPGYARITFFREWLRKVQAKSRKNIPPIVFDRVFSHAKRAGYTTLEKRDVRKILKVLKLNDYYDADVTLAMHFNNVPVVDFSEQEVATFVRMFEEAEDLFERCPSDVKRRKNFLSYSYFLYKVCEMLEWDAYLPSFPLLSGAKNLRDHDRVWKWMCEHKTTEPLWTFYLTTPSAENRK